MRQIGLLALAMIGPLQVTAAADDTQTQIAALHELIFDPAARFSARAILSRLDAIRAEPGSKAQGQVAHMRAIVEQKSGRGADALKDAETALRIDATTPFLASDERIYLVYNMAQLKSDADDCTGAIPLYQRALDMMEQAPSFNPDKRLGTQEKIGYCLHEGMRYAEARSTNEAVLVAGEALHGRDSPKLMTVLTNLAQNAYELGDKATARTDLERVLAIATKAGAEAKIDDMLFQLGVLAFEEGRHRDALDLMDRRLALAKASGDATRLGAAQRDLDELHTRLGK